MKDRVSQWLRGLACRPVFSRHSREGGNPATFATKPQNVRRAKTPGSRLRGNDGTSKWFRRLIAVGAVAAIYPAFVLISVYAHWFAADLPGGRNGPADAYRHSLASATVAYTGSPHWVAWITAIMEHDGAGNDMRAMDAHNNRLGARIGTEADSWRDMQAAVRAAVAAGGVHAGDADRITWLPRERWQNRLY